MLRPRSVLITGASSGIGRALALAYAGPQMRLALIGRDGERLREAAQSAASRGADVDIGQIDVRDRAAMQAWIAERDTRIPFDLAIANAGITTGLSDDAVSEDPEAVRALIATNLIGVLNTVEPLIAPMCARGRGQLAFIGSIAGLRGLPYSPAYCASKAAVHVYAESLRGRLERKGVLVSLVIAGFVKTPLNDSISSVKPFELSDTQAAEIIRRGLARGKATIIFPLVLYFAARFGRVLPARLTDRLLAQFDVEVPKTKERVHS
ncbi:MAG TPA: SDR family NAD(P)-dependent oxidoreductase [Methylovirgula sp.]|nr:SDR family NAD(P)-dependent oxidoreductase [Methylovirgula sp.]